MSEPAALTPYRTQSAVLPCRYGIHSRLLEKLKWVPHESRPRAPGCCKVQGGVGVGEPHAHLALVAAPALLCVLALRVVPAHRQRVVAAARNLRTPLCRFMHMPPRAGSGTHCSRPGKAREQHLCRQVSKQAAMELGQSCVRELWEDSEVPEQRGLTYLGLSKPPLHHSLYRMMHSGDFLRT